MWLDRNDSKVCKYTDLYVYLPNKKELSNFWYKQNFAFSTKQNVYELAKRVIPNEN